MRLLAEKDGKRLYREDDHYWLTLKEQQYRAFVPLSAEAAKREFEELRR